MGLQYIYYAVVILIYIYIYSTTCHSGHLCKEVTCSMGTANPRPLQPGMLFIINFV